MAENEKMENVEVIEEMPTKKSFFKWAKDKYTSAKTLTKVIVTATGAVVIVGIVAGCQYLINGSALGLLGSGVDKNEDDENHSDEAVEEDDES